MYASPFVNLEGRDGLCANCDRSSIDCRHWRHQRAFRASRRREAPREIVLACADYPDIVTAIEHYLKQVGASTAPQRPREGAFAIAGPVTGDVIRMTNHVWQFSAAQTRQKLKFDRLIFMNDFTALAMAVRHLPASELEAVGGGRALPNAPIALLGPGTGLGVSGLIPAGDHWIPLQGEAATSRCP